MKICVVEGCGRPAKAKGFCQSHYNFHRGLENPQYHENQLKSSQRYRKARNAKEAIEAREFRYGCSHSNLVKHAKGFLAEISRHISKGRNVGDIAVRMGVRVSVVQGAINQIQQMANTQTA